MKKRGFLYAILVIIFIFIYIIFAFIKPFNDYSCKPNAEYFSYYGTFISGILMPILTLITIILLIENYMILKKQNKNFEDQISFSKISDYIKDIENNMIKLIEFKNIMTNNFVFYHINFDTSEFSGRPRVNREIIESKSRKEFFSYCLKYMKELKTKLEEENAVDIEENETPFTRTIYKAEIHEYQNKKTFEKVDYIYQNLYVYHHDELEQFQNIIISMFDLIETKEKYQLANINFIDSFEIFEKILFNYFRNSFINTEIFLIHYIFYNNKRYLDILRKINFNVILERADNYLLFPEDKDYFIFNNKETSGELEK